MSDSHHLSRKGFVNVVVLSAGAIMGAIIAIPAIGYVLAPALKVQKKETWIPLGPLENYPVGTPPTLFSFTQTTVNGWEKTVNSFGVYVMRYSETELKVFSNMCTHLSCRVTWQEDVQEYVCPCHDGRFDENGNVIAGPPPIPMWEYETKVEDGILSFYFVAV